MSAVQQALTCVNGVATVDIGDNIANSLMLDSASSQYLSRTFGTPTSTTTWTISFWVKRAKLSTLMLFMDAGNTASSDLFHFKSTDLIELQGLGGIPLVSAGVYRDPAAWNHVVIVSDTTNGTATQRLKIFVNGTTEITYSTDARAALITASEAWGYFNKASEAHRIGIRIFDGLYPFNGYFAQYIFVDGQALTPSSFGRTSADTGQWVNKTYAGTYGNNGFKLDFANSADLGNDVSGNNNDWTTNGGISSSNQYTDTPTNNYAVWNALVPSASLTLGNTKVAASTLGRGTIGIPSTMKAYWEVTSTGGTTTAGMLDGTDTATTTTTITTGVTKGFRFDAAAGTFDWTTDGSSWTAITTGLTTHQYKPYVSTAAATTAVINAGQKAWTIGGTTPPTGYSGLGTANLPTPAIIKPALHMNAKTRTGTGATYSVTGELFAPDLVWTKGRSGATDHAIYDAVRGVQLQLETNTTSVETTEATGLTAFNSDGYTAGALAQMNTNTATYIDWMWKGGGAAVANTAGTITSSVSANITAGISIVTYTGTGANATVGHGLGVVPKMMIVRGRDGLNYNSNVYHSSLANTEILRVSTTDAKATAADAWNSTTPTSTLFSVGTRVETNGTGKLMLAYCFAEVEGFSKAFSYTGNVSTDGPFIYLGFKPRWVFVKRSDSTSDWHVWDTARNTYNVASIALRFDTAETEATVSNRLFDLVANGIKIRDNDTNTNASGGTYIGFAIAEAPMKFSTAR